MEGGGGSAGDSSGNDLTQTELADLERRGTLRRFRKGTTIFHEEDRSDHVALIKTGRVKVSSLTEEGREVVLAIREPGDLVGEFAPVDGEARSATATALDELEATVVPGAAFRAFLVDNPRVSMLMLRSVVGKLRDADRKRVEFSAADSIGRVAARLVELAGRFGKATPDGIRIDLPITQQELAGFTGASRESVAKALQSMRSHGWIDTSRKQIVVRDLSALEQRST